MLTYFIFCLHDVYKQHDVIRVTTWEVRSNMAARQFSVVKELTECCVCTEVMRDPRVLPCQHTFCLQCLVNCGSDKQPGNRMPCPLCRTEFTIPADGLSGTQKNYDMEKLLSARKLTAGEDAGQREGGFVLCDVCSSEAASSAPPPATKRCLECQQNYCDQRSRSHSKINATASHVVVPNLQNQVKSDGNKITELEEEKTALVKRLGDVEGEINTAADKLIAAVERDRVKLLSEVESIRLKRVRQLETVKQEVEQHLASLDSLSQYAETLLSSGTAGDVTTSANSSHSKAEELTTSDVIGHVDNVLPSPNVTFTPSTRVDDENLVGPSPKKV